MEYKIGLTSYDDDHELWETHVGIAGGDLLYSVWGRREVDSKARASSLVASLTREERIDDEESIYC